MLERSASLRQGPRFEPLGGIEVCSLLLSKITCKFLSNAHHFFLVKAYRFFAKAQVLNHLTYRFEAFAGFVLNLIPLGAIVYVWRNAYQSEAAVVGGAPHERKRGLSRHPVSLAVA